MTDPPALGRSNGREAGRQRALLDRLPTKLLYVEDDEDIRDTMTMLLEHEGYHVLAVSTAEEALDELGRNRQVPSLDEDRIVVTPTLVVRAEGLNVWIAGDLSDTATLDALIARTFET
jgi:CheY-like chemotaxis protein